MGIIVHVGLDFEIVKTRLKTYALDFFVATYAALVPLIMIFSYLRYVVGNPLLANIHWGVTPQIGISECLLLSVFSAPTSAGMLISMLEAANLKHTWVFKKASMLAILDDIDSLVFISFIRIIAIKGNTFDLAHFGPVIVTVGLLTIAWFNIHKYRIPHSWPHVLCYAVLIGSAFWGLEYLNIIYKQDKEIHKWLFVLAVLIPSFTLGVLTYDDKLETSQSYKFVDLQELTEEMIEKQERIDSWAPWMEVLMGCLFMFFVGLSMPALRSLKTMGWLVVSVHVGMINVLMLAGKLLIWLFYAEDADYKQRLALGLAMCPRGEIGASVIIITIQTLKSQISGEYLGLVVLSVIGNLVLSCGLIIYVKQITTTSKTK